MYYWIKATESSTDSRFPKIFLLLLHDSTHLEKRKASQDGQIYIGITFSFSLLISVLKELT